MSRLSRYLSLRKESVFSPHRSLHCTAFPFGQLDASVVTTLEAKWSSITKQLTDKGLVERSRDSLNASFYLTPEGQHSASKLVVEPSLLAAERLNEGLAKTAALEKEVDALNMYANVITALKFKLLYYTTV